LLQLKSQGNALFYKLEFLKRSAAAPSRKLMPLQLAEGR
jgi:hypothetical protein